MLVDGRKMKFLANGCGMEVLADGSKMVVVVNGGSLHSSPDSKLYSLRERLP